MGHYSRGDVVLAPVAIEERSVAKTRPAMVIGTGENNYVFLCPISSKPAIDAPCVPICLCEFSDGGLDLFGESYVLTSRVLRIRCGEIIGKKGRLIDETTTAVLDRVPQLQRPESGGTKNNRRASVRK
jgi:hypothetical protein